MSELEHGRAPEQGNAPEHPSTEEPDSSTPGQAFPPADVTFEIPLPPPFGRRRVLIRSDDEQEGRAAEDMMLRSVPRETAMRFRAAAGGRGLTYAQYLAALVALHERARALADGGDAGVDEALTELGLQTVTV